MKKSIPLILSIIGKSDSGKTTLILKLLPALKRKGYKVAVAKHCPCGFDLDLEGKDSFKFTQAGGEATFLTSPDRIALIRPKKGASDIKENLENYFSDFDLVLMEGYNSDSNIKKMQVFRKIIGGHVLSSPEIVGYVSDDSPRTDKPVYGVDDILGIVSFIETFMVNERIGGKV